MILDRTMGELIRKYGIKEVLASLCRECSRDGQLNVLFNKLNRVYEWYVLAQEKRRDRKAGRQS